MSENAAKTAKRPQSMEQATGEITKIFRPGGEEMLLVRCLFNSGKTFIVTVRGINMTGKYKVGTLVTLFTLTRFPWLGYYRADSGQLRKS